MIAKINTQGAKYYRAKTCNDNATPTEAPRYKSETCKDMNCCNRYSVLPMRTVLWSLSLIRGKWHVRAFVGGAFAQKFDLDASSISEFTKNYKQADKPVEKNSNETHFGAYRERHSVQSCLHI